MISIRCSCRGEFWVRDRLAGNEVTCPACEMKLAVPPLESVKKKMTPAACTCGEVFWSSYWQIGKASRCPICGDAVGPSRSRSGATMILEPEARNVAAPLPETRSTWADDDSPPPEGGPKTARGSATGVPWARPPVPTRGISTKAISLAAGAVVLMVVGLLAVSRSPGPGAERRGRGSTTDTGKPKGGGEGGGAPAPVAIAEGDGEGRGAPVPGPIVAPSTPLLRILVPAYFYPAGDGLQEWDRLIEAAPRVPITAIVNPASGPGTARNPDYAAVVRRAKAAGVEVIGYVSTKHGKRPRPEIEADIDRWVRFYPDIQGIFLDAQASGAEHVDLYVALRTFVRRKIKEAVVIGNPGKVCAEEYLSRSAVDVTVLFAAPKGFDAFDLPSWAETYPARQFAAIPYSAKTTRHMKRAIRQAFRKGIGYLHVSDGDQPNPWRRLPPYWDAEVDAVKWVNKGKSPLRFPEREPSDSMDGEVPDPGRGDGVDCLGPGIQRP